MDSNSQLEATNPKVSIKRSQKLDLKIDTLPEKIKLKSSQVKKYERRCIDGGRSGGVFRTITEEDTLDEKAKSTGIFI